MGCRVSYTDYTILDKLFELCPFVQTVLPHDDDHVEGFFLTHTQSPLVINFDMFFPYQNIPDIRGFSEKMISLKSMLGILPINFGTQ